MPKYKYHLSNGKFLSLEGDNPPSDDEVSQIAKEQGVELMPADSQPASPAQAQAPTHNAPTNEAAPELEQPGILSRAASWATKPLINAPTRFAESVSHYINPNSETTGLRGIGSAYIEGLGHAVSGLTSPLNLATAGVGAGETAAAKYGAEHAAEILGLGRQAASVGMAAHGASQVLGHDVSLPERALGALELLGGIHGTRARVGSSIEGQTIDAEIPPTNLESEIKATEPKLKPGQTILVKAEHATPDIINKAKDEGYEFQGHNDQGDFRFKKVTPTTEPPSQEQPVGETKAPIDNTTPFDETPPTIETPPTTETPTENPAKLDLTNVKPKLKIGNTSYNPVFDNDVDKALFELGRKQAAKKGGLGEYVDYLTNETGLSREEVLAKSKELRESVKTQATDQPSGDIQVPKFFKKLTMPGDEGTPTINPEEPYNFNTRQQENNYAMGEPFPENSKAIPGPNAYNDPYNLNEPYTSPEERALQDPVMKQFREFGQNIERLPIKERVMAEDLRARSARQLRESLDLSDVPSSFDIQGHGAPTQFKLEQELAGTIPAQRQGMLQRFITNERGVMNVGPRAKTPIESGETISPTGKKPSILAEVANLSRSLKTSMDMSAPLRQGLGLIHKPEFWKNIPEMFKAAASEEGYQAIQKSITDDPLFSARTGAKNKPMPSIAEEAGLKLTDLSTNLNKREESLMSNWAEKVPGVRASNRAYTAFLNKTRADVFKNLVTQAVELSHQAEATGTARPGFLSQSFTPAEAQALNPLRNKMVMKELANFVNTATGRGDLGKFEGSATALNSYFFAPRLVASRLRMLNPGTYINASPMVRQEAIKSLLAVAGFGTAIGQLAKLGGSTMGGKNPVTIEPDPASADFGKIKIGNVRIDPFGGFQQYLVLAQRMLPDMVGGGRFKSTINQRQYKLGSSKFGRSSRLDVAERFLESKVNPMGGLGLAAMRGTDFTGKPFNLPEGVADLFVPMFLGDVKQLATENPDLIPGIHKPGAYQKFKPGNLPYAIPSFFGMSEQQYGPKR